jgi:hypothetical protein
VIMSDDLIGLQIPAFDHLIFGAREQVWVTIGYSKTADGRDMSSQG